MAPREISPEALSVASGGSSWSRRFGESAAIISQKMTGMSAVEYQK